VASAASHLIGNVIPGLEHVRDPDWPAHAGFHVLQAIGLLTGMDLIAIALALGPLRRRDRWALWTELTYVLFAQGGYFASLAVLPKGRPGGRPNRSMALTTPRARTACCWLRNSLCGEKGSNIKVLLRTPAAAPAISAEAAAGPELFFARTRHGAGKSPSPKDGENPRENPFLPPRSPQHDRPPRTSPGR
jgi:hypothetical protein